MTCSSCSNAARRSRAAHLGVVPVCQFPAVTRSEFRQECCRVHDLAGNQVLVDDGHPLQKKPTVTKVPRPSTPDPCNTPPQPSAEQNGHQSANICWRQSYAVLAASLAGCTAGTDSRHLKRWPTAGSGSVRRAVQQRPLLADQSTGDSYVHRNGGLVISNSQYPRASA